MKTQILIDEGVIYTRIAVAEDNILKAIYLDSNLDNHIHDAVIIGEVKNIVKDLNAAFIDIGSEKNGLLHMNKLPKEYKDKFHQGSRVAVQVVKENEGDKGHKLTGFINLVGKHFVCLPFENVIGISKNIKEESKRKYIYDLISEASKNKYGIIARTSCTHATKDEMEKDIYELIKRTDDLINKKDKLSKGTILYKSDPMYIQIIKDIMYRTDVIEIVCNSEKIQEDIEYFSKEYGHDKGSLIVKVIDKKEDMFYKYDIEKEISELLRTKVWLKNGGNLIINYTEAMTIIDVNSAKSILSKNHKKAIAQLNKLAVEESIYQIIRRNLSGIIVIDLVDMNEEEDRQDIYDYAKGLFKKEDQSIVKVYPVTQLGLLCIARNKRYTSFNDKVFTWCSKCGNKYGRYSLEYLGFLIEQKMRYTAYNTVNKKMYIKTTKELIDYLSSKGVKNSLSNYYGVQIDLIEDNTLYNTFKVEYIR